MDSVVGILFDELICEMGKEVWERSDTDGLLLQDNRNKVMQSDDSARVTEVLCIFNEIWRAILYKLENAIGYSDHNDR